MFLKILAFILRRKIVHLIDFDGEVTSSLEFYKDGKRCAKRFDFNCELNGDGTVKRNFIVDKWFYG